MAHKANFSTSLKKMLTLLLCNNSYYKSNNLHIQNIYNDTISPPTCFGSQPPSSTEPHQYLKPDRISLIYSDKLPFITAIPQTC
jgi:hypothetical protein